MAVCAFAELHTFEKDLANLAVCWSNCNWSKALGVRWRGLVGLS